MRTFNDRRLVLFPDPCAAANGRRRAASAIRRGRFADRDVMERPCRHRTSFRLDILELDYLGPLLGLIADELAKIGGRAHKHRTATLSETPLWVGTGGGWIYFFFDLFVCFT